MTNNIICSQKTQNYAEILMSKTSKESVMKKQIAFLRGINVGNIRIKMPDLKLAFEKLGFQSVKTYLQTGNVVFESDKSIEEIKPILEKHLSQTFDYEAFVLLFDFETLADIVKNCPFQSNESHHAYVLFIENEVVFEELKSIAQNLIETAEYGNRVIYSKVKKGESTDTPFAKILAKTKYKSTTTTRNLNTLEKMISE
jgi:uncharacterized protein (DUF1697 family)